MIYVILKNSIDSNEKTCLSLDYKIEDVVKIIRDEDIR